MVTARRGRLVGCLEFVGKEEEERPGLPIIGNVIFTGADRFPDIAYECCHMKWSFLYGCTGGYFRGLPFKSFPVTISSLF